jgi:hypothetical protein
MSDLSQLTAAPLDIRLGGRTFALSPLADADLAALDNWVRMEHMRAVRAALVAADREHRDTAAAAALEDLPAIGWSSPVGQKLAATAAGQARLVWQSIHARLPDDGHDVTPEWIQSHLDPAGKAEFWDAFAVANRWAPHAAEKAGGEMGPPRDRDDVYRALAARYGWSFAEIAAMSRAQQAVALSGGEDTTHLDRRTGHAVRQFPTVADAQAFLECP